MRVLLVEDNDGDAFLVRKYLADYEVDLTRAKTLGEASSLLDEQTFDLILLDLNLPDGEGLDGIEQLSVHEVPIVVLTGSLDESQGIELIRHGAQDHLSKNHVDSHLLHRAMVFARERHDLEKDLERTQQALRASRRMEAVGRLTGGIAHDFNNLLTTISNLGHFVLQSLPEGQSRQDMETILEAAGRAAKLTGQLMAFARQKPVQPTVMILNRAVLDLQSILERALGGNIECRLDLDPALWPVKIDAGALDQVLMNLAVNARDAMPDGGELAIRTRNAVLEPDGDPELPAGEYVEVSVIDNGQGIPEDVQPKIFEPFFTTKPAAIGTGLGLSTCHGIARQAGGDLVVSSTPGEGSTFTLRLPRSHELQSPVPKPTPAPAAARINATVLVVEDERAVRQVVKRILGRRRIQVLTAKDGSEALELAQEHAEKIDLVLTDVVMPELSGRALVEKLEGILPGVPMCFMSGYSENELIMEGTIDPSVSLLQKPFSPNALVNFVLEALD